MGQRRSHSESDDDEISFREEILRTRPAAEATIDRLRELSKQAASPVPSVDQVHRLVAALPGADLQSVADASDLDAETVLNVVADLGTWLGRGAKSTSGAVLGDSELPPGFRRKDSGRKLSKAYDRLVSTPPSADQIGRWVLRQVPSLEVPLTFEIVATVHRVAQIGRLDELEGLVVLPADSGKPSSINRSLARLLVDAYEFQEVHRSLAAQTVRDLISVDPGSVKLAEVEATTVAIQWLAEGPLVRLLETAWANPPKSVRDALIEFRLEVLDDPVGMLPDWISDLSDGSVQRLAEWQGLPDRDDAVKLAPAARAAVAGQVLEGDDEANLVTAISWGLLLGLDDQVAEALEARARFEPDWAAAYNDAVRAIRFV